MESLREFLWAKSDPRKSLYTHMYEAAVTIRLLMTDSIFSSYTANIAEWLNLADEEAIRLVMYLAALHDLGKLHPCFQKNPDVAFAVQFFEEHPEYIDAYPMEKDYRHEKGTCSAVKRIWETEKLFDRPVRRAFANSLLLHHQGKDGKDYRITPEEDWDHPEWIELQDELEQKLRDWLQPPQLKKKQIRQMDASCTILTAMIILTDWIVSSEVLSMFPEPVSEKETEKNVRVFLKSSGMDTCPSIPGKHIFEVWTWLTEESMRPMQKVLDSYLSAKEEKRLKRNVSDCSGRITPNVRNAPF